MNQMSEPVVGAEVVKYRILVVDDEAANLQVVGTILREQGQYSISLAMNGEDALRQARLAPPDLILLDVMMPGISGYEVCRQLKMDEALQQIPVIFLSAKAGVEDYVEGFEAGGTDYISKPFIAEILLARMAAHLKLSAQQRELHELYQYKEQMRREERNAAYQNGLTEMGASVLHTIGNAITETDAQLYELNTLGPDLSKVGDALQIARQLLQEQREPERVLKLLEFAGGWLNGSGQERFNNQLERLYSNIDYIKEVLDVQRRLTHAGLVSTQFELPDLIADVEMLFKDELLNRKITFQVHNEAEIRAVTFPRSPMGQLLVHLINNSLEAIERHIEQGGLEGDQGAIELRIIEREGVDGWILEIEDNGDGIEPALINQVLRSGVTTKVGSAGLGLHSAANFMVSIGGSLQVLSEGKGKGTMVQAHFRG